MLMTAYEIEIPKILSLFVLKKAPLLKPISIELQLILQRGQREGGRVCNVPILNLTMGTQSRGRPPYKTVKRYYSTPQNLLQNCRAALFIYGW